MAYAIMRIEKIKTEYELNSRYDHNYRIYDVANADPSLEEENKEIVDLMGKTYLRAFDDEITRMRMEGNMDKVRSNAVLGLEVMLTYSRDKESLDVEHWIDENVKWLQKTFNPPDMVITKGNGEQIYSDNVKSVVVHMDEITPHIHAFVVPIDGTGKLNAKYYLKDRRRMIELQNEYHKAMKQFDLQRGIEKSVTRHQDTTTYYRSLKEAVSAKLPEPRENETIYEYKERADECYMINEVHHHDEVRKLKEKINRLNAELRQEREAKESQER